MSFDSDLGDLGFSLVQQTKGGSRRYAHRSHDFLQWWVIVHENGTAELNWEFELGAYLNAKGFHVSAHDELSLFLFPREEPRGPVDISWVKAEIERAEAMLASVDLVAGL